MPFWSHSFLDFSRSKEPELLVSLLAFLSLSARAQFGAQQLTRQDSLRVANYRSPDSVSVISNDRSLKEIRAVRIVGDRPIIDGQLDEEVWKRGHVISDFWQREPKEGAPATESTKVRVLYDEEALYVAARMYSKNPEKISAAATRRDQLGYAETLIINLDCYRDRKTSYSFGVTAAGVKQDYYHPIDDEIKSRDVSFNPVWEAKTAIDSLGWTVEFRIPFSQVRFRDEKHQIWGVNFNRYIPARNEDVYWQLRRNRDTGWASLFGDLMGIEDIRPSLRIEILPYGASSARFTGGRDLNNPFDDGRNLAGRIGADLKMGLGPNLTLDATINPDFGQVEADPAVVNLTAFETFFTERRPFFVEGNRLLSNTVPVYFYSRRIGAAPHGSAKGSFVDQPTNSTILGAAKISGRLGSGLSLAALSALTAREYARTYEVSSGSTSSVEVEPLTSFGVVRLEQEFGPYVSTAGVTLTGVRRWFRPGTTLPGLLVREAFSGGGNWNLRFQGGMYELGGDVGFSYVNGEPAAVLRLQTSSARYFQRPDATYSRVDSSRTSLFGYTGRLAFNKNGGEHWLWGISGTIESPGFELNDIGRITSVDDIEVSANLHYRETLPTKFLHNYDFGVTIGEGWDFDKVAQYLTIGLTGKVTWKNYWRTTIDWTYKGRAQSDDLTRGGPMMGTSAGWNLAASTASGVTSKTKLSIALAYGTDELGGWSYEVSGSYAPRPADEWELSFTPRFTRSVYPRQYVTTLTGGRAATFGRRYIFSFIEQSTLSMQIRFAYNFSPELSLELYAEPFAASGRYYDFGELLAAQSRDLRMYGTDGTTIARQADGSFLIVDRGKSFALSNRDFNVRSFRSNVVLRWEWRLGSTLYFVWQQNRASTKNDGNLVTSSSLLESFAATGDNILAIKLSYWLPVD
jgi:hypothetical protein